MSRLPVVGPKPRSGDKAKRQALAAIYAELPTLECQGLCAESCGPIFMSRVEWQSVCRTAGEERKAEGLDCPLLENERCSVYEVRPMICRLWGLVESMPCPWGCKPDRYLTHEEGLVLLDRVANAGA